MFAEQICVRFSSERFEVLKTLKHAYEHTYVRSKIQDTLPYSWDIKNFSPTLSWQSELGKQPTLIPFGKVYIQH